MEESLSKYFTKTTHFYLTTWVLVSILLGFSQSVQAFSFNTNSFKVTVIDNKTGEPLIGASVIVQGTTNGTITDIDGSYTLDANQGDVLVASYVGYQDMLFTVDGSVANINMSQGVLVDEVVVTGYQSQRKRDITGAVAVIGSEELNVVPAASLSQKLAGKASGVTISTQVVRETELPSELEGSTH